jgi:peptidoglycan/LPS O-acetylase OafA/YrhL
MASLQNRLPSLDGLRALSILAVLFGHLAGTRGAYQPRPFMGSLAILGVRVFFVLSGFLITFLLLQEQARTGAICLRAFYFRRMLRIFPVFYAFLLVVALLKTGGILHLPWIDLAIAGSFWADFRTADWNVSHFWSLSTEEQFYFFWPALLVFAGSRSGMRAALVTMAFTPLLSGVLSKLAFPHLGMFFLSVNAIGTGCVLALARPRLHHTPIYIRALRSRWIGLLPVLTILLSCWEGHSAVILDGVAALCIAVLVDRVITMPGGFTKCLNWKPVAFVGTLSYSLYVWQQIFLNRWNVVPYTSFPVNLLLTIVCALLSHFAIERPFLSLRGRMSTVAANAVPVLTGSR